MPKSKVLFLVVIVSILMFASPITELEIAGLEEVSKIESNMVKAAATEPISAREPSEEELAAHRAGPKTEITITDVKIRLNGTDTDIGDITASLSANPEHTMEGRFTVGSGFQYLCRCIEFHWVQKITQDDCPANYEGHPLPTPVVDPPKGGWDYMYSDGAGRQHPIMDEPNYGWFIDNDPWYYNALGESHRNVICQTYDIRDVPGFCPGTGRTSFETWLVGKTADKKFCLIRGYSWSVSTAGNIGPTDLGAPDADDAADVSAALTNGKITGWTVEAQCNITCSTSPPPSYPSLAEWVLIVLTLSVGGFFVWQLKRGRKAVVNFR